MLLQAVGRQRRAIPAAAIEHDVGASCRGSGSRCRARGCRGRCGGAPAAWSTANSPSSRTSTKWKRSPRSSRARTSATVHSRMRRRASVDQREKTRAVLHVGQHSLYWCRSAVSERRDYYEVLGVEPRRRCGRAQARLSQARDGAAPRPQPGRPGGRGALQGGVRGLPGAVRSGEARALRPLRARGPARPAGGGFHDVHDIFSAFSDIFGDLFGGADGRRRAPRRPAAARTSRRASR